MGLSWLCRAGRLRREGARAAEAAVLRLAARHGRHDHGARHVCQARLGAVAAFVCTNPGMALATSVVALPLLPFALLPRSRPVVSRAILPLYIA